MNGRATRCLWAVAVAVAALGCTRSSAGEPQPDAGGVPAVCPAGETACWQDQVATCLPGGVGWTVDACAENQVCLDGVCRFPTLAVATTTLPDGMIDVPYTAVLESAGGVAPFVWSLAAGDLPPGVDLLDAGTVAGTPTTAGSYTFTVGVRDAAGATATGALQLVVHPEGLVITTTSLPVARHGLAYSAALQALGGEPPYSWGVGDGALPAGVVLTADGRLAGAASELGAFPVTFRVFDHALPPAWAERELTLTVDVAPLEIVGGQVIDLIVTKVVVLPLIVVVPGLPVPYSTPLEARGGLTPYHWSEIAMPSAVHLVIPTAGIPPGLTLDDSGTLHGAVTDASQIITVTVPLSNITLTGFFFAAQVDDSQTPAASRSAVYLLPTVPLGG
jgi:hypothetical protein